MALGDNAGGGVIAANNVISIGAGVGGEDVSNTCYIGNIFGVTSSGENGRLCQCRWEAGYGYLFAAVQR